MKNIVLSLKDFIVIYETTISIRISIQMFTLLAIENNQISRKIGASTCFQLQRSGVDFLTIIRPAFALSHKMLKNSQSVPFCTRALN